MKDKVIHNDRSNRLMAFTLMDVLSGMIIMSIVIIMVFGALNSVNKQTNSFQKLRIELNDFILMESDISRELDESQEIFELPNGFVLSTEEEELKYTISGGLLLRESELRVDTLHKSVSSIKFGYLKENQAQKMISEIWVKTTLQNQNLTAYFFKEHGKKESINQQLLNEF